MQPQQSESPEEINMMKLLHKIQMNEAQKTLLTETMNNQNLLASKIISSLNPRVGRIFADNGLEYRKKQLLENTRKKLLSLALEEKEIEIRRFSLQLEEKKNEYVTNHNNAKEFLLKLEKKSYNTAKQLNGRMNKKVTFHASQHQPIDFTKGKNQTKKKRKWTKNRKKKNRINYRRKEKQKQKQKIKTLVEKIKESNTVVNLSNQDIPAATYLFLAKGLGFVPSSTVDKHDLKYDTAEFLRKLAWRAFFKANPELQNDNNTAEHEDIRVSAFTQPSFNHPSLEEIKTKLYGWIANHQPKTPEHNLTPLEMRGRKWLLNEIGNGNLFVTKADKGGATLIMNRTDVQAAIEKELFNTNKFEILERNAKDQLSYVKEEVKSLTIFLEQKKYISNNDKTLITGLTENNRPKLAPEYQPESPYLYPLFKIHKLTPPEINEKKIPPSRLVHASKYGPLYRMEKWTSPYLSTISKKYCGSEFVLDTGNVIRNLELLNQQEVLKHDNVYLFTMDVEALYPSINPQLALEAIQNALSNDTETEKKTKLAIDQFIKLSFNSSYVTYKDKCYKSKIGIPTGGSLSRQIADCFLHWILFMKTNPSISDIQAIRFWNRFIDDVLGIWRGTRRSFDAFIKSLNQQTNKLGINFPLKEVQFGKSVHFLDLTVYLDEENTIHYRGYTKPTDCKRYLNPNSFHPKYVFNSIPFSQILRILRNNSKEETKKVESEQCIKDFTNSGYKLEVLQQLKVKTVSKIDNTTNECFYL